MRVLFGQDSGSPDELTTDLDGVSGSLKQKKARFSAGLTEVEI